MWGVKSLFLLVGTAVVLGSLVVPAVAAKVNDIATAGAKDGSSGATPSVLGAERFEDRELAKVELWKEGEGSVNLLTALTLADDPEQAWRARQLLRWVDLEMTPETPPEIVELVENYLVAKTAKDREVIYNQLLEKEAYVQLFRLPRHITDEIVSRSLAERVAELAGRVAEEKILAGEDLEALSILEDARNAKAGQLRWVSLASALGLREELWEELSSQDKMRFARWEGDAELIKSLATPDHEIQLTLDLLAGEPLPYLEKRAKLNSQAGLRARLAKSFWTGKEKSKETQNLLKSLTESLEENGLEESKDVLVLLAQLGYAEEVLPYFEEAYPVDMFEYYHRFELLDDAFRCLGLKVGEVVPQQWVDESLAMVKENFEVENEGCRRLLSLALFFVERGEIEEGERLLDALYAKVDELGPSDVNGLLSLLAGRQSNFGPLGYPDYAIRKAQRRNEEVFQPETFLSESFFGDESIFVLYRFLGERGKNVEPWDRVRQAFAFLGREVEVEAEEMTAIHNDLEKRARETASEGDWNLLRLSGIYRGNFPLLERAAEAMTELQEDDESALSTLASIYFSDGRFQEAADIYQKLLADDPSRYDWMEALAVSLELSGKSEEAEKWLLMLEKLALGDGNWLVSLGNLWGTVGDFERQYQYFERAFLLHPAETSSWFSQLRLIADSARRAGYWKKAAACQEVYNSFLTFELIASPRGYFNQRGEIDWARAMMALQEGEVEKGDRILDRLVGYCGHESFFADDIFPVLRREGWHEQAERLWGKLEPVYRESLAAFPDGHNAHNTAAWAASRAACDLEDAMKWVDSALKKNPNSPAYLDTKAEVFFAQGNREEALKWSEKACSHSSLQQDLGTLRIQYRHFRDDPFPLSGVEGAGE